MKKIKNFLKSKHKVEYETNEIVPWYKGFWYYTPVKNRNICVILPLCIPLIILRNVYYVIRLFGMDSMRFYERQIKLRINKIR